MDNQIIQKAVDALNFATKLGAEFEKVSDPKVPLDGYINVTGKIKFNLPIECKKNLRTINILPLVNLKETYKNLLVITDHIYPNIAEQLRLREINYLDTVGNIYIHTEDVFIYLQGIKTNNQNEKVAGRAFGKAGLKFIYYTLTERDFLNQTYRQMAERCDTALGNITYIINDLVKQDFFRKATKNTYYLNNREKLLQEWVLNFEKKLKPQYLIGTFRFAERHQINTWLLLNMDYKLTKWGGEPATEILTGYLKPALFTLYTLEKKIELIKKFKLIPDEQGYLKIYEAIFPQNDPETKTVHPLIVYADLINTADPRTDELAKMIYNGYIKTEL